MTDSLHDYFNVPAVEFRSEVSGMWYTTAKAAGTVDRVRVGDITFYRTDDEVYSTHASLMMLADHIRIIESTPTGKMMRWAVRAAALLRAVGERGGIPGYDDQLAVTPRELMNAIEECVNLDLMGDVLELLEQYALTYTDEELAQLAATTSGMGEVSPEQAAREIKRREIIKQYREET